MIRIFIDEQNPDTKRRIADMEESLMMNHELHLVDILLQLSAPETVNPEPIVCGPGRGINKVPLPEWMSAKGKVFGPGREVEHQEIGMVDLPPAKVELKDGKVVVKDRKETWNQTTTAMQQLNVVSY